MKLSFRDYLKNRSFIRHCGATGTELMKLGGVTPGALNNMVCPEKVYAVQKEYVDAGVEISLTNTFAMNPLYAAVHAKEYDWREINLKGIEIAKKASQGRDYIFGNMGPVGEMLVPFGPLAPEDAYEAYRNHARVFAENDLDGISVQTFFSLDDMVLAVKAIRSITDMPIIASLVFNANGATMMGDTPEKCYDTLKPLGIDVFGHNCGEIDSYTLGDLLAPLAAREELPIIACPNAGVPKSVNGNAVYDVAPEEFYKGITYLKSKGIRILGGCCGVSDTHIRAIADLF